MYIYIHTYVYNHCCFPIQISTHKWSFAYLKLLHIFEISILIGTSFAINLKTLRRRMTCSTSIRVFAILFVFVTSEGSI